MFYNFALLSSFPANGLWSKGSIELPHFLRGIFSTEPPWKRDGGNVFDLGYAYAGSMFLTLGERHLHVTLFVSSCSSKHFTLQVISLVYFLVCTF